MAIRLINITRNRDTYTFYYDNGFEDSIDFGSVVINSYDLPCIFTSPLTRKPMKAIPSVLQESVKNLICTLIHDGADPTPEKRFYEMLLSLPNVDFRIKREYLYHYISDEPYSKADWKIFVKNITEKSTIEYVESHRSIKDISNLYAAKELIKRLNNGQDKPIIDYIITKYNYNSYNRDGIIITYAKVKCFRAEIRNIVQSYFNDLETIKKIDKAIHDIIQDKTFDDFGINMDYDTPRYRANEKIRTLYNKYNECITMLEKINMNDFQFTNIERDYENIQALYNKEKTRIENEFFARNQKTFNLTYENEDYKVVVPTTRQQLAEIGNYFHNCANGYEWNNFLSNGSRLLVVIVDKSSNKMAVCVDMYYNSLQIKQFLGINNKNITNNCLLAFKKEYQNYLSSLVAVD